jgi:hypothetical protein
MVDFSDYNVPPAITLHQRVGGCRQPGLPALVALRASLCPRLECHQEIYALSGRANPRATEPNNTSRRTGYFILAFVDNLSGAVEHITFYDPENGYTVLHLRPEVLRRQRIPGLSYDGLTTVVGNLPELSPGKHVRLQGLWDTHPKHGTQFNAELCEQSLPASLAGMESYLGSGGSK